MGCDIHAQIEYRKRGLAEWHWLLEDAHHRQRTEGGAKLDLDHGLNPFPLYRDYEFFGMLAGVRDEEVPQFPGSTPYYELSDLVEDVSDELAIAINCDNIYLGDHSFHIIDVDKLAQWWDQVKDTSVDREGYVSLAEYKIVRMSGEPPAGYSGGVGGGRVVRIDQDVADAMLDGLVEPEPDKDYFVLVKWQQTLEQLLGYETSNAMNGWLTRWLIDDGRSGEYEFRYVIGFDS